MLSVTFLKMCLEFITVLLTVKDPKNVIKKVFEKIPNILN